MSVNMSFCWNGPKKRTRKLYPPEVEGVHISIQRSGYNLSLEEVLSFYNQFRAIAKGQETINEHKFTKLLNELNVG